VVLLIFCADAESVSDPRDVTAGFSAGVAAGLLPNRRSEIRLNVAEKFLLGSDDSLSGLDLNAAGPLAAVLFKPAAGIWGRAGSMNAPGDIIFLSCIFFYKWLCKTMPG
jgi:hypothetical protein